MSAIYNLEPQPTASVILHTTLGEISVELFAKQTPLTSRNFLQLALDGYYDSTVFHRLVPNFILQGGDPTGTGNGGESIYDGGAFSGDLDAWPMDQRQGQNAGTTGINVRDEFHSRLKFTRRGLLAMANEGRPHTNGSQFFFTLDKSEELNGKNTLFGRVAGDTIYNLVKIGELDVDPTTERPLHPVKLLRVEILVNPFEDMKKRARIATQQVPQKLAEKKEKKKRKGGKQLLSFGDDEGGDVEDMPALKKTKYDTRIVVDDEPDEDVAPAKSPAKKKSKKRDEQGERAGNSAAEENAVSEEPLMKPIPEDKPTTKLPSRQAPIELSPEPENPKKTALEKANEEIAALKASMRRTVHTQKPIEEKKKTALEALIPETSVRARKRRPGGNNTTAAEDQKALNMLKAFQSRLGHLPDAKETGPATSTDVTTAPAPGPGADAGAGEAQLCDLHFIANCQSCTAWDKQADDESDDEGWMAHSLSFAADRLGKDLRNRKKGEEELVVIDPREKARTLKEERRAEREAKAGGGTGRAWDQARDQAKNAQMARAASLAGRGAR